MSPPVFWAWFHLRRNLRRRGTILWVLIVPLLAALMRLVFGVPPDPVGQMVLVYLVPLMSLAFGGGVLREEVEDQTLTYGFTRPLDRASIYVARWAAAAGPVLLASIPAALFATESPLHALGLIAAVVLGVAAHTSLFSLWGLLTKRPSWIGLVYVLVWEQALQNVPGWLTRMTLRSHLRNLGGLDHPKPLPMIPAVDPGPWWLSAIILIAVTAICLALAARLVRSRELVLSR